jgi:hypothetical protein
MNKFILWYKRDIVLTTSSPPIQHLEGVIEEGEILPPSRDHLPEMPHSSPLSSEHVHEMPQSSPPPSEHVPEMPQPSPPHKEQGPDMESIHEQPVPLEEVHAQEDARKEPEIQKKHPITIRPIYTLMRDITSTCKWYAHDQFKPENKVKEVPARAFEEAITSTHQLAKKYQNVDAIKWSKNCPQTYERGSPSYQTRTSSAYHLE